MELVTSLNASNSAPTSSQDLAPNALIWQDVIAQAITGELVAVANYTALAAICTDPHEVEDALEHAAGEQGHARAFAAEGRKLGFEAPSNIDAKYWKRLRSAFMRAVDLKDFIACLIIQEIMLESFAVASYKRVAAVAPGTLGQVFAAIATEEEDHIDHAMQILRDERAKNVPAFDAKLHLLHLDVMTTLAEMLAREDKDGHCELCHGACVKPMLPELGLTTAELRGAALQHYLRTLDALGLPGETTLTWVSQLPV